MRIERRERRCVTHLRVQGCDAVEFTNAADLRAAAVGVLDESRDVVVDLAGVDSIDSAGVGALVSVFKVARSRGRKVVFASISPGVRSVLEVIRLDEVLDLSPDAESAIRAFGRATHRAG